VPNPKVSNFTTFLINIPKCLWVVYYEETVVGFILISDSPHRNSIGFSINLKFTRMGIISSAWELIKSSPCINYPIYAVTSQRNNAALRLLEKLGFRNTNENLMFGDESSYKLIFE
jgi:RimJ/RimL family protein N-acetyltransferase